MYPVPWSVIIVITAPVSYMIFSNPDPVICIVFQTIGRVLGTLSNCSIAFTIGYRGSFAECTIPRLQSGWYEGSRSGISKNWPRRYRVSRECNGMGSYCIWIMKSRTSLFHLSILSLPWLTSYLSNHPWGAVRIGKGSSYIPWKFSLIIVYDE